MEACWAHNPEVRGSKPRSAKNIFLLETFRLPVDSTFTHNHVGGFRTPKKSIHSYEMYIHSILLQQLVQFKLVYKGADNDRRIQYT